MPQPEAATDLTWWQALGVSIATALGGLGLGHRRGRRRGTDDEEGCDRIVQAIERASDRQVRALNALAEGVREEGRRTRQASAQQHQDTRHAVEREAARVVRG